MLDFVFVNVYYFSSADPQSWYRLWTPPHTDLLLGHHLARGQSRGRSEALQGTDARMSSLLPGLCRGPGQQHRLSCRPSQRAPVRVSHRSLTLLPRRQGGGHPILKTREVRPKEERGLAQEPQVRESQGRLAFAGITSFLLYPLFSLFHVKKVQ